MWCFVTTHGDEDRGDLFDSKASSLPVKDVSPTIIMLSVYLLTLLQFFAVLLIDVMSTFFASVDVVTFMLVCGGLVSFQESKAGLKEVFSR